jgi:pimeloyl-ACP methyl ester carboxylesterase
MYIRYWGDPNASKKAILIHGLASASTSWNFIARELVSDGYYVIAPDLPGHGKSHWEGIYSYDQVKDRLAENLNGDTPDLLVGHSLGGLIAADLAIILGARKTVLIDPVFRFPNVEPFRSLSRLGFNFIMLTKFRYHFSKKKIGIKRAIAALGETKTWDPTSSKLLRTYPQIIAKFKAIESEALIVKPKFSYISPTRLVKLFPTNIRTVVIGASHNLHLEDHESFMKVLKEFLTPLPS